MVGLGLVAIAAIALVAVGAFAYTVSVPKDKNDKPIIFEVKQGQSIGQIAGDLQRQGIITSAFVFESYSRLGPAQGKFTPGPYRLSSSLNMRTISRMMASGQVATVRLTIPEGYTIAKIAKLWQSNGLGSAEEFTAATKQSYDYDLLKSDGLTSPEGYLFPATYEVKLYSPPGELITQMLQTFAARLEPLLSSHNTGTLSAAEVVKLASIVELEGRTPDDRKMIAGIFLNRLARGMKLESDVTINYVTGKSATAAADLKIISPYNSYLYKGLPPTPVSNPGREAILAVLEPTKSDYLFFLAGRDGVIYYAKTLTDHEKNIKAYLQ